MTDKTPEFSVTGDAFLSAVVEIAKVLFEDAQRTGPNGPFSQKTLDDFMDDGHKFVTAFLNRHKIPFTDHRHR